MCIKAYMHGKATVREASQVCQVTRSYFSRNFIILSGDRPFRLSKRIYCALYGLGVTCIAIH